MNEIQPAQVEFIPSAILNVIRHSLAFLDKRGNTCQAMGALCGSYHSGLLRVETSIPIFHSSSPRANLNAEFFGFIHRYQGACEESMIGWYRSNPGKGIEITKKDLKNHRFFDEKFPGSIGLLLDPNKIAKRSEMHTYLRAFGIKDIPLETDPVMADIKNITIVPSMEDVIASYTEIIDLIQRNQPIIWEMLEYPKSPKIVKEHSKKAVPSETHLSGAELIDLYSSRVLNLKKSLGIIKKRVNSLEDRDIMGIIQVMKKLKRQQVSLSNRISIRIDGTEDIETKFALIRIRDSLSHDLSRLDGIIDDLYMKILIGFSNSSPE